MAIQKALIFSLNGIKLGVSLEHVREVLFNLSLHCPPEMSGLLRGFVRMGTELIPVIRLEDLLRAKSKTSSWTPEEMLHSKILLLRCEEATIAFYIDPDVEMQDYESQKLVSLPKDHVLNDCVQYVIAMPRPQASIILLEPNKLLLAQEKSLLQGLRDRESARLLLTAEQN